MKNIEQKLLEESRYMIPKGQVSMAVIEPLSLN